MRRRPWRRTCTRRSRKGSLEGFLRRERFFRGSPVFERSADGGCGTASFGVRRSVVSLPFSRDSNKLADLRPSPWKSRLGSIPPTSPIALCASYSWKSHLRRTPNRAIVVALSGTRKPCNEIWGSRQDGNGCRIGGNGTAGRSSRTCNRKASWPARAFRIRTSFWKDFPGPLAGTRPAVKSRFRSGWYPGWNLYLFASACIASLR
jgi:hypothetical protein